MAFDRVIVWSGLPRELGIPRLASAFTTHSVPSNIIAIYLLSRFFSNRPLTSIRHPPTII